MPQKNISKEVQYINRDYVSLRDSLIDFAKVYFPDSYNDFNEASIGMMFMEMSAYVGDVLAYYMDSTIKEQLLLYAEERNNIIYLSQMYGYKYKTVSPAFVTLDVYQLIPSKGIKGEEIDFDYALKISEGMTITSKSNPNVTFRTTESVDFRNYKSDDFVATIYQVDDNGYPLMYLLKKSVEAVAGRIVKQKIAFGSPIQFNSITLPDDDIIEILDVTDSDGNKWYEVDYLAQDSILFDDDNNPDENTQFYSDINSVPKILKYKRVSKRFTTRKDVNNKTHMYFGSGTQSKPDRLIVPTPEAVKYNKNFETVDIANSFMNTKTYGYVPANTELTITYSIGGGLQSNVPQGDLTTITYANINPSFVSNFETQEQLDLFNNIKSTLSVNNPEPATGGRGEESNEEIRQNAIAFFMAQDRCVTATDYVARTLQMPVKYGSVTKAFVRKDINNFALDLYVLGYDSNKNLVRLNNTVKQNLSTYLSFYRDLTTAINIKDAYPINIGVNFVITVIQKFNKNDVLLQCVNAVKNFFNIDNWQIGQPIVLNDIYTVISEIDGVKSVLDVEIVNLYKSSDGYNNNYYHIPAATVDGVIYPSTDPSIFEVKFPSKDIYGKAK
jgi:hypothetical protein